ncbi:MULTISPECIES: site-specific DNA-methyltransferase [Rhodobacterales]|uniref:site-specific DNA-methyltransferase (adenine-specific) n=1 Tax=Phaeobacter piscinae TaxID=1580596 RepID=A0ABM6PJH5_9RHOB|nr:MULTISPECIES: site-specific DNA-methyltransferase [Rhodobacterales]ATG38013.1 DNA modification methylase [Phaeobacter piscinae]AUQ88534.1 DNA modification methylase [Phaeobacter piscinae]
MEFDFDAELSKLSREELERLLRSMSTTGIALSFHGKRTAMQIAKRVKARQTRREPRLHIGTPEDQSKNMLIEGENLQAMVTLYKFKGQVDLIVTDPPYNTGQYFRYNDRWDDDPNDPDLGLLVPDEDGSKKTKWMKFMWPRLQIMKAMLKATGVLAICIDHRELFRLGQALDEIFGEKNRLAIINWQKSAAPRPDNNHVSTSTEYVLVYAKDAALAESRSLARTASDNTRYGNPDNDPNDLWREGNLTARSYSAKDDYAIQSPFTGELHYPAGEGAWRHPKRNIKSWLGQWGSDVIEKDIGDGKGKALLIKGGKANDIPAGARKSAFKRLEQDNWPFIWFGRDGKGRPRTKTYLNQIKKGKVPVSYWADELFTPDVRLDAASWDYSESGRSSDGVSELSALVGEGHGFVTVKPLKLISKIIQIWCPPNGLVLDPFAGSGTTGHAVLWLNQEEGSNRRFILMEQGAPENGDKYARTLTWQRLHNAITGDRPDGEKAEPLGGGFEYRLLTKAIDARAVLSMQRDELIDVVLTSHWETHRRSAPSLRRIEDESYQYLIGQDENMEGYFLIWDNGGPVGSLSLDTYKRVAQEAKKASIEPPFHVYARYELFQSPNVRFWKIPDKILADLGLTEHDEFNNEDEIS